MFKYIESNKYIDADNIIYLFLNSANLNNFIEDLINIKKSSNDIISKILTNDKLNKYFIEKRKIINGNVAVDRNKTKQEYLMGGSKNNPTSQLDDFYHTHFFKLNKELMYVMKEGFDENPNHNLNNKVLEFKEKLYFDEDLRELLEHYEDNKNVFNTNYL